MASFKEGNLVVFTGTMLVHLKSGLIVGVIFGGGRGTEKVAS